MDNKIAGLNFFKIKVKNFKNADAKKAYVFLLNILI